MTGRAHVLSQVVMQNGLYPSIAQQLHIVSVEVVPDEEDRRLLLRLQRAKNGDIAAAHRIDGCDMGIVAERAADSVLGRHIEAMSTARIDQLQTRMMLAQCAAKANLALLFAPEMLVTHRYQHIGGLRSQQQAKKIRGRGTGSAIIEPRIGDAPRQRYVGDDRDDRNAVALKLRHRLCNLGNVPGLQENTVTSASNDRPERLH